MSTLYDSMKANSKATVLAKQQANVVANNTAPTTPPVCPDVSQQLSSLNATITDRNATVAQQQKRIQELETGIPDIKTGVYHLGTDLRADDERQQRTHVPKNLPTLGISMALLVFFVVVFLFYDAWLVPRMMRELQSENYRILFPLTPAENDPDQWDYTKKWQDISRMLNYARFLLFVVVFLGLFGMINLLYMIWLRGSDINVAYRVGSLTLFIVLGLTFLVVNNQTMIKPFENVVGYAWLHTFSRSWVQDTLDGLFRHRLWKGTKGAFPDTQLSYDFLVSVFRIDTFRDTMDDLLSDMKTGGNEHKYDLRLKKDGDDDYNVTDQIAHVKSLYQMSLRKNTIGHLCWIYFASLASVMISMKYLVRLG